jgi:hypothetical protein
MTLSLTTISPMRYRTKDLERLQEKIVQLGLQHCPVCDSGLLGVSKLPAFLHVGDFAGSVKPKKPDPDGNVLFLVHVECNLCGYVLLFNSETLAPTDTIRLVTMTEEEEAQAEADGQFPD